MLPKVVEYAIVAAVLVGPILLQVVIMEHMFKE